MYWTIDVPGSHITPLGSICMLWTYWMALQSPNFWNSRVGKGFSLGAACLRMQPPSSLGLGTAARFTGWSLPCQRGTFKKTLPAWTLIPIGLLFVFMYLFSMVRFGHSYSNLSNRYTTSGPHPFCDVLWAEQAEQRCPKVDISARICRGFIRPTFVAPLSSHSSSFCSTTRLVKTSLRSRLTIKSAKPHQNKSVPEMLATPETGWAVRSRGHRTLEAVPWLLKWDACSKRTKLTKEWMKIS